MTHPMQGDVPPIDRNAEELMPTAENDLPSFFKHGAGITTTDVLEIALMYVVHLTGATFDIQPGALRSQGLPANRVAQLSPSSQRFMEQVKQP